jgi:hypothetical protein
VRNQTKSENRIYGVDVGTSRGVAALLDEGSPSDSCPLRRAVFALKIPYAIERNRVIRADSHHKTTEVVHNKVTS